MSSSGILQVLKIHKLYDRYGLYTMIGSITITSYNIGEMVKWL